MLGQLRRVFFPVLQSLVRADVSIFAVCVLAQDRLPFAHLHAARSDTAESAGATSKQTPTLRSAFQGLQLPLTPAVFNAAEPKARGKFGWTAKLQTGVYIH